MLNSSNIKNETLKSQKEILLLKLKRNELTKEKERAIISLGWATYEKIISTEISNNELEMFSNEITDLNNKIEEINRIIEKLKKE